MTEHKSSLLHSSYLLTLLCAALAGCTGSVRAPVEDRSISVTPPPAVAAPALARPGYHIVKRGETLYSIALEYGHDYREVAAWNGIENPAVISTGQELRVAPPEAVATSDALAATPLQVQPLEVQPLQSQSLPPLTQSAPAATAPGASLPPNGSVILKEEPKGGRIAYSPDALANLQAPKPAAEPKPADAKPAEARQTETKPSVEPRPAASAPVDGEDVAWMWPARGNVLATFNDANNKGVDIAGTLGDPVLAAGPGRVVYVGNGLRGYGNLVIIKHNNTYLSAYAHNSQIAVKEGQSVQKGQKIAELGNTDADRPKLHFEIRRQGKPVDPLKYLPAR